jgi:hypothetical protein
VGRVIQLSMGILVGLAMFGAAPDVGAEISSECRPFWQVVPSPDGGPTGNGLQSVASLSPSDVWAVGSYFTNRSLSLIEHWDGRGWAVSPHPEKGQDSWLLGVDGVASNDVWSVGYYHDAYQHTLAMHWTGSAWSIVPTPDPGLESSLWAVDAISATDVWAVGQATEPSGERVRALVEHWDGRAWSVVPVPDMDAPEISLLSVSAASSADVWAVGEVKAPDRTRSTLAMHWDGSSWEVVPTPSTAMDWNTLDDVIAISADQAWAVGWAGDGPIPERPIAIRWDGLRWMPSPLPAIGPAGLEEIVAVGPDGLWAVGLGNDRTATYHWDGHSWRFVPGPAAYQILGAAALSPRDVWVVGATLDESGVHTLTEQLCGT